MFCSPLDHHRQNHSPQELTHENQPSNCQDPSQQSVTRNSRIPPEGYNNFVLVGQKGTYYVKSLCWDDGDLMIYQIINDEGKRFQAQQFELRPLPNHLYSSRKRRIHRLRKAQKIFETIESGGIRILITPAPRDSPEDRQSYGYRSANMEEWHGFSSEDFPSLSSRNGKCTHGRSPSVCSNSSLSDPS